MRVAVFGAGSWGTAFSMVVADAGHDVTIWGRREEVCRAINDKHENVDYLADVELPTSISATPDPADLWPLRMLAQLAATLAPLGATEDWLALGLDALRDGWG